MSSLAPGPGVDGVDAARSADATRSWRNAEAAYSIRRIAVLGAGTMGSRIAAHVANAGFPVLLLDLATQGDLATEGEGNRIASRALEALKKNKPPSLASSALAASITVGNFDDDLPKLKDCDWVIEAVAERMEIKRGLLAKVAPYLRKDAVLTTNTSGLPVHAIAQEFPGPLRARWMGTHFFNPPRYMQLLELITTPETDPEAAASIARFAEVHLGKTVVPAKDSPNFIANRIGVFAMLNTLRVMQQMGLSIEEVDALTGMPLGWPKTGTFRLADMVGIDVLVSVIRNFQANVHHDSSGAGLPPILDEMIKRGWLGDKSGQGFYKKQAVEGGAEERFVLDLETLEYRPARKPKIAALEMAKTIEPLAARIRALLAGDPEKEKAAAFYWHILPELWTYSADRIGEISDNLADIDRAMRAGFNWELGPFQMWDAAGVRETTEKMRARGQAISRAAECLLAAVESSHDARSQDNRAQDAWYRKEGMEYFDLATSRYLPVEEAGSVTLSAAKRSDGVFRANPGASLVDIGDGIGCIEFHSKMNTLGRDTVTFLLDVLTPGCDALAAFRGFVITNDAANFSAGANLMQLLLAAQDEEWDEIDLYIRAFQAMTQAIKFCPQPVVAAPFGLCLGGGSEVSMHAAWRQAHFELYMGLVETSVGLLPAGGGSKEMAIHAIDDARQVRSDPRGDSVEVYDAIRRSFETVAMARVSTSAIDARACGLLNKPEGITMNRARLLGDAKFEALRLAEAGYTPPLPRNEIPAPGESVLASLKMGVHLMREAGYISSHDVKVAGHLAQVLCGGAVPAGTPVSEQYFLDLEREAFLSLCGEPKSQERIAFTLKTGKPLRN